MLLTYTFDQRNSYSPKYKIQATYHFMVVLLFNSYQSNIKIHVIIFIVGHYNPYKFVVYFLIKSIK